VNKVVLNLLNNINPSVYTLGFFLFLSFAFHTHAQKVIHKSWDANAFDRIEIISDEVFKIEISTLETSEIKLSTTIEGENYESLNIGATENNRTLLLKPSYRPYFKAKNDKLAAHKVMAIEMKLLIPKSMELFIDAKIASLVTDGSFKKINANLSEGNCVLYNFDGSATINTKQGDITVFTTYGASGEGISKYGSVRNELSKIGIFSIKAESVNGNITLKETPE